MRRLLSILLLAAVAFNASAKDSSDEFWPNSRTVDRHVLHNCFGHKGEWFAGFAASYGKVDSSNSELLVFLESIDASGSMTTFTPHLGYFYKKNHCVGARFSYRSVEGSLDNLDFNLGEGNDIDMNLSGLSLKGSSYGISVYHRSYLPLDRRGIVGLYGELELVYRSGRTEFLHVKDQETQDFTYTDSYSRQFQIVVSPGISVHIFPFATASIGIGLGGFKYATVDQYDANDVLTGTRRFSSFKFNIMLSEIYFGVTFHFGGKKNRESSYK